MTPILNVTISPLDLAQKGYEAYQKDKSRKDLHQGMMGALTQLHGGYKMAALTLWYRLMYRNQTHDESRVDEDKLLFAYIVALETDLKIKKWAYNNLETLGLLLQHYQLSPENAAQLFVALYHNGLKNPNEIYEAIRALSPDDHNIGQAFATLTTLTPHFNIFGHGGLAGIKEMRWFVVLPFHAARDFSAQNIISLQHIA